MLLLFNGLKPISKAIYSILVASFCVACSDPREDGNYVGYVEADWIYVSAPQSGLVIARQIIEGEMIISGQTLFELEAVQQTARLAEATARLQQATAQAEDLNLGPRVSELKSLQAQLIQARAQFTRISSEFTRIQPLVTQGIESQSRGQLLETELKVAEAGVATAEQAILTAKSGGREQQKIAALSAQQSAQGSLDMVIQQLAERTIKANVAGRVERLFYAVGEYTTAGSPMAAILPSKGLRVRFFVPQEHLGQIELGQSINVSSDIAEGTLEAKINYIAEIAEFTPPIIYSAQSRKKLVFMIEATLSSQASLHPGLPVDITL